MMYFYPYSRNNHINTYRQYAPVTWDEKQMVIRLTSNYHLLKYQNQQLRQRITELEGLVTNQNQRANDQNWEMHYADQGNTKYSTATMPVDLTLLTLKKDPFTNASALFSVNKNQLYSADRISKKILSATDLDTYKERWNFSTRTEWVSRFDR